jgi:hypothetical protein
MAMSAPRHKPFARFGVGTAPHIQLYESLPSEQSLTRGVGENACVPAYTVNGDAVRHAKRLIDARQYVLRSRWQDVRRVHGSRTRS